jgi:hypothetical protein
MLAEWHEFYALIGTAAAALVALLFVAVSIGASVLTPERASGTRTFMSPVVFHYTAVLFLSLIALIPTQTLQSLGWSVGFVAAMGFVYALFICVRVVRADIADMADNFGYGGSPAAAYAVALVAAWLLAKNSPAGLNVLAGALLLLLIVNIRNAWDLTLSLARRHASELHKDDTAPPPSQPPSP